jgi:prepilin-type N-terminal cleavage/methylation domain-containing protein/prepilin-type processing-associated H-X9-DG protein
MNKKAFTLIELLVVIAIISILASMLFPVFSRARAKGRQAACLSNQKQIVVALLMYAEDFDEIFPAGNASGLQWYEAVYAYTHNYQIMYCPDRKDSGPGYGMNWLASNKPLGSFWDAASKILIGDVKPEFIRSPTNPGNGWPKGAGFPDEWWINDPDNDLCLAGSGQAADDNSFAGNGVPGIHNEGVIYGFADGHVKWVRERMLDNKMNWDPEEKF